MSKGVSPRAGVAPSQLGRAQRSNAHAPPLHVASSHLEKTQAPPLQAWSQGVRYSCAAAAAAAAAQRRAQRRRICSGARGGSSGCGRRRRRGSFSEGVRTREGLPTFQVLLLVLRAPRGTRLRATTAAAQDGGIARCTTNVRPQRDGATAASPRRRSVVDAATGRATAAAERARRRRRALRDGRAAPTRRRDCGCAVVRSSARYGFRAGDLRMAQA